MEFTIEDLLGGKDVELKDFYEVSTSGKTFVLNIDDEIGMPIIYRDIIKLLESLTSKDTVIVKLSSPGGVLDSGVMLYNAIKACKAKTVADVSSAASAATLITLACKKITVRPHGYMMIHTFSGGYLGKGQELKAQQIFMDKHTEVLFNEVYQGFLSDEELKSVLNGTDIWLTADEIQERVNALK